MIEWETRVDGEGPLSVATEYSVENCPHSSMKMIYHKIPYGTLYVLVCVESDCNYSELFCEHAQNSWNKAQTNLTCDLCGVDGT